MEEIHSTKCACNKWPNLVTGAGDLQLSVAADMREYIGFAQLDQSQFNVVAVSEEI
jgi:hypothetical protein